MGERIWWTLCRAALRLYPRDFRQRNGAEILRVIREQDRRLAGRARDRRRFRVGTLGDLVWSGLLERRGVPSGFVVGMNRGGGGMDGFVKDARYALRSLRKSPGFTAVAVITIALGIAANTSIFSVVRSVLLAPLPYEDPGELVVMFGELQARGVTHFPSSPPDFRDFREQGDLLEDLAAVATFQQPLMGDGEPQQVTVGGVTPNFFDLLGVSPRIGRSFVDSDATPDPDAAQPGQVGALPTMVMLDHGFWQQYFGDDPAVVGRTLELGGGLAEIVGILPADFELLMPPGASLHDGVQVWAAMRIDYATAPRNNVFLRPVGRLADGTTLEQAQAQADRIAASLAADDQTKTTAGYAVRLEPLHASLTAEVRPILLSLMGAVLFVLLIACANVANLLMVRAAGREREIAVRAAMGGSRPRIVRQLLMESALLAGAGAALGVVLAAMAIEALMALQPGDLPRIGEVALDGPVLLFTALTAAAAAAVFGLVPALNASRTALAEALQDRGTVAGTRNRWVRKTVVVGEVALSVVLLIGAGLMVRSFIELNAVEPGYTAEGLLTFQLPIPGARYPSTEDRTNLLLGFQDQIESIPGVRSATAAFPLPLSGNLVNGRYGNEDAVDDPSAFRQADFRFVLPGYFETMETPVLEGRAFSRADHADSAMVVVVDQNLAERLWPGESAVGKRILIRAITPEPEWMEVVGVVAHQRAAGLAADGPETVYFHDRYPGSFAQHWAVRTDVDPLTVVAAIQERLRSLDPSLPMAEIRPMTDRVSAAMGSTRFALTLIGVFGVVALVLASVGLYGVLSYVARQRTSEIGVRLAFGAESGGIVRLIVGQGLAMAGLGIVLGLATALPLTRFMASFLVGISPTDPMTFAGISLFFAAVAGLACYLPARRAARVDPMTALRDE